MTPQPSPAGNSGRLLELDALRGLAAVAVLVTHLPRGFWFGETGVDLFFVLSGYLITSIILRHRDQSGFLRTFYYRRALRIFPIYYLALFVVLVLNLLRKHPVSIDGIWYYFIYAQNVHDYWGQPPPDLHLSLGHTWTLAIEEQFYLLWPAAVMLLRPKRAFAICLILAVLPLLLRAYGLNRTTLFGHTDGLALGACLAFLGAATSRAFSRGKAPLYGSIALGAFVAYALLWSHNASRGMTGKEMVKDTGAILIISVAYCALVAFTLAIVGSRTAAVLRFRPLVWIGTISYGLYLYHWIIYELLDTVIKFGHGYQDPWWLDVIKVFASFAAATISWYAIERPLLKFKDAFSYRPTESGVEARRERDRERPRPEPAVESPAVAVVTTEE